MTMSLQSVKAQYSKPNECTSSQFAQALNHYFINYSLNIEGTGGSDS